jgi:cyclopropane-fatty-acyl-phospholipid synthase
MDPSLRRKAKGLLEKATVESIHNEAARKCDGTKTSAASSGSQLASLLQQHITQGCLILVESGGRRTVCGQPSGEPVVTLHVHHEGLFARVVAGGSLALGESYADGWWSVTGDRLCDLFSLLFLNRIDQLFIRSPLRAFIEGVQAWRPIRSVREKSREDIRMHYDLSNDFFSLMLDPTMMYSCGYARDERDDLATMQQQKLDRIARKLNLERGGELLDIGCGWGGLLLHVANNYPQVRGLGVTLSEEQYSYVHQALRERGFADRFRVQLLDYRDLRGCYDFVVSVGMFEHVGYACYSTFFDTLSGVLKPSGTALLHTIGLEEEPSRPQDPWVEKHIFPGSRLPRLEELARAARQSQLAVGHVENWRPHYALTLKHWRRNFVANWSAIQRLGTRFDARFFRKWDLYLQLCEACFIDSTVELYQLLLTPRAAWNLPLNLEFNTTTQLDSPAVAAKQSSNPSGPPL